ncbi:MAG: hypothetical protein P8178_14180 [Candidatus Thiodiazotropha sp.]
MSERITQFENEMVSLWYYPEEGIIHHQFHQATCGADFQNVLLTGLQLMKDHKACKWLSDDTNNTNLPAEDSAWSQDIWLPRAIKAGWKYWAMIPPVKARGRINIERLTGFVIEHYKINVKIFSDPEDAWAWLAQQAPHN